VGKQPPNAEGIVGPRGYPEGPDFAGTDHGIEPSKTKGRMGPGGTQFPVGNDEGNKPANLQSWIGSGMGGNLTPKTSEGQNGVFLRYGGGISGSTGISGPKACSGGKPCPNKCEHVGHTNNRPACFNLCMKQGFMHYFWCQEKPFMHECYCYNHNNGCVCPKPKPMI